MSFVCLLCLVFLFVWFLGSLIVCLFIYLLGGLHIHIAFDAEIRVRAICIALIFPRCSMYGSFQIGLEQRLQFSFG